MKRIIYLSSSSYFLDEKNLVDLYELSHTNNLKNGITGLFIYSDQDILQVLEGPSVAVTSLYHKISKDKRHTTIILLFEETIENRYFPDWQMGFYVVGYEDIQKTQALQDYSKETIQNADAKKLLILLELFLKNHPNPLIFV
jgi:hypothetical protein